MQTRVHRRLFLGFVQIHILHHATAGPVYGAWMLEELSRHGYMLSPGTMYLFLHAMQTSGLLLQEQKIVNGKIRKYYIATRAGEQVLEEARKKAAELVREINR